MPHVQLGVSVEDQATANERIVELLGTPAAVRFVSIEPMLGPVNLDDLAVDEPPSSSHHFSALGCDVAPGDDQWGCATVHWVIAGGESGPHARPPHPDWFRSLRDQCAAAGVPFTFKQWGEWCPRGPEAWGYPSVEGVARMRLTDAGTNGQNLASAGGNHVWMNRAGKKAAGRLLDGVEHNGFPGSA